MNFAAMQKKFALAERFVIPRAAGHILRDVRVDEICPARLEIDISIADVCFTFAQSFYFGAVQHEARFELLKNMVVVRGGAILRDDLLARLSVFALGAISRFVRWLGHNLSFYLMMRLTGQELERRVGGREWKSLRVEE